MNKDITEKIHILVNKVLEVENTARTHRERRLSKRISNADTKQAGIQKQINRLRKQKISSEEHEKKQRELKKQHKDTLSRRGLI